MEFSTENHDSFVVYEEGSVVPCHLVKLAESWGAENVLSLRCFEAHPFSRGLNPREFGTDADWLQQQPQLLPLQQQRVSRASCWQNSALTTDLKLATRRNQRPQNNKT